MKDKQNEQKYDEDIPFPDDNLIEEKYLRQLEEESNGLVLRDAALIKSEPIKGDQTQIIY